MSHGVAIIGAGYVGLPLAIAFAEAGERVVCVDIDAARVAAIGRGESHIEDVPSEAVSRHVGDGSLTATADYAGVSDCGAILICVPTPLSENREPDVSMIAAAAEAIAPHLRRDALVVLESTTYPGTTRDVLQPILERSGLVAGADFHLAMSPERIDPGRTDHTIRTTPKVVGGLTPACLERAVELYRLCVDTVVPVSSPDAAELVKLLENIFRSVNIALVNELAMLCERLGLNVWEVVDAAATKPYGFMRFSPGPGLGGHCIPIDPFYLSWRARQFDFQTEFIELAGKVNTHMPYYCAERIGRALNRHRKPVSGSRRAAARRCLQERRRRRPRVARPAADRAAGRAGRRPQLPRPARAVAVGLRASRWTRSPLDDGVLEGADIVCVVTAHSSVDYARVADRAKLLLDFRNVVPEVDGKVERL